MSVRGGGSQPWSSVHAGELEDQSVRGEVSRVGVSLDILETFPPDALSAVSFGTGSCIVDWADPVLLA